MGIRVLTHRFTQKPLTNKLSVRIISFARVNLGMPGFVPLFMTLLITFLSLMIVKKTHAREDIIPGSRYTSARGAAMGNALIPYADDGMSALFYNPAAIARLRGFAFEPFNVGADPNQSFAKNFNDASWKIFNLRDYVGKLKRAEGERESIGGYYAPAIWFRGFAGGLLYQQRTYAQHHAGKINYRSKYEVIPAVGFGIRLASGVVRLGYALHYVSVVGGKVNEEEPTAPDLAYRNKVAQGAAMSHNAGFALSLPFTYLPAINIVGRNLGNTKYNKSSILYSATSTTGTPKTDNMSIDVAMSGEPKLGGGVTMRYSLEYRDLMSVSGVSPMGHAALGTEISFRDRFFLRGGLSSGYPSAGIGMQSDKAKLGFAWHSEEIGGGFREIRDIRYMIQIQLRLF